jgi:eukaryotic-like serine/threonine-protein kinase
MSETKVTQVPVRPIRFGEFEADLLAGELRKNGLRIKLQEQPFRVLCLLLERAGEVVTREELRQKLWSTDTFVDFEHSLNTSVKKLRQALGDSADSPRFVETLARRGYRFIAPLELPGSQTTPASLDPEARAHLDPNGNRPAGARPFDVPGNPETGGLALSLTTLNRPSRIYGQWKFLAGGLALLLLVAFLSWWILNRPTAGHELLSLTRLTSDAGLTTDAVISPDGKLVAYASDRGGNNLDIWVRQVSGGDPIQLTHDPADDHQPSFSPDGGQIVFRSEREGGGIYVVSPLGGENRLRAPKGRNPRFSPTGDWIAFWVGLTMGYPLGAQAGRIFLIPPTGGAPREIDPRGIVAAGCPIWSPDGTHLLFYGSDKSNLPVWYPTSDWWVWPLAGGNAVKTGAFEGFATQNMSLRVPSPVPVPSEWIGNQVFFSAKTGDSVNLWQVSISPENWRITGPAHRVTSGSGLEARPSLSRTGLLVFSSLAENADIWSLPIDASHGQLKGSPEQLTRNLAADYSPSLSADGKTLAFASSRSGNTDIWIKDLESGKEESLVASPAEEISPRVSPDGSLVSYLSRHSSRELRGSYYVIEVRRGLVRKLCDGCFGFLWGWSPDNRFLFFRAGRPDNQPDIGMIDLATGKIADYLQSPSPL